MNELRILFEFLLTLLPEPVLLKAIGFAPIVVATVGLLRYIPWFAARKRWAAPLAALLFGQGFGYLAAGFDPAAPLLTTLTGLVITLAAIGGFSTVKNAVQAAKVKDERKAA